MHKPRQPCERASQTVAAVGLLCDKLKPRYPMKRILTALLTATSAAALAADYYVSPNGLGDGSAWSSPLGTIEAAMDAIASAGDTSPVIWLDSGTHYISRQQEILLNNNIIVRGRTGNPADVTVTRPAADDTAKVGYRLFNLQAPEATLKDITISGGKFFTTTSDMNGANVYVQNGLVDHCIMENGDTSADSKNNRGAGFYIKAGRVTRCIIRNNKLKDNNNCYGAGAMLDGGQVDNCLFYGNNSRGGSVRCQSGSPLVYNCTIAGNDSYNNPGLYVNNGSPKIYNCVIADNTSKTLTSEADLVVNSGKESYLKGCVARTPINANCFTGLLLFKDVAHQDYRPVIGSVCIDNAGAQDCGWTTADFDLAGESRVANGIADIGCYEWTAATAGEQVTLSAIADNGVAPFNASLQANVNGLSGTLTYRWSFGDGTTEETATPWVSHPFNDVGLYTVSLTVKDGASILHPAFNTCVVAAQASAIVVGEHCADLPEALALVANGGEIILPAADSPYSLASEIYLDFPCTIRGETGNPDDVVITRPVNSAKNKPYRLIHLNNADAFLRDVIVENGSFSGSSVESYGANILIDANGGTVSNCVIRNANTASGNHRCGGVCIQSANGLVTHCVITNNTVPSAGYTGGSGAYLTAGRIDNCLIAKNTGRTGALYIGGANAKAYNCTIVDNKSVDCAGINFSDNKSKVVNCIIVRNTGSTAANGVYNNEANAQASMTYCVTDIAVAGTGNVTGSPDFSDAGHMDYTTTKNSCNVAAGDNTPTAYTDADTDLAGNPRLDGDGNVDIGCYQWTQEEGQLEVSFDITAPGGTTPLTVTFTPHVEGATVSYTCAWDFDGDGETDATSVEDAPTTFTYENTGSFASMLTVIYNGHEYPAPSAKTIRAYPKTLYVDSAAANPTAPYDTVSTAAADIQSALNAGGDGCEVVVLPGDYVLTSRVNVTNGLTLRSSTGNPDDVRLHRASGQMLFVNHEKALATGLTLRDSVGGCTSDETTGVGVRIDVKGGTVSNCVVRYVSGVTGSNYNVPVFIKAGLMTHCAIRDCTNNIAGAVHYTGGGVNGVLMHGGTLADSLIADCRMIGSPSADANAGWGPLVLYKNDNPVVVNCTVAGNEGGKCGGVRVLEESGVPAGRVVNTHISGNKALEFAEPAEADAFVGPAVAFSHCASDSIVIGEGSVAGPAGFRNAGNGDYRVTAASVVVNAGTDDFREPPSVDLGGRPRLQGRHVDIGCYESGAQQTLFLIR